MELHQFTAEELAHAVRSAQVKRVGGRPVIYPFDLLRPGTYFDVDVPAGTYTTPSASKPIEAWRSWKRQRRNRKHKAALMYDVQYRWLDERTLRFYVSHLSS